MSRSLFSRLAHTYGTPPPPAERREAIAGQRSQFFASYPLRFEGVDELVSVTGRVKVAIVGGGFAGLSAAWWLSSHGFQVQVFDARDRAGGRVYSPAGGPGGTLIEHGGELVGRNHPNWIEFAKRFDLGLSLLTDEGTYSQLNLEMPLILNGEAVDEKRQEQIFHEMQRVLIALNADAVTIDPEQPWRSPRAEEWDHQSVANWISAQRCSDDAKAALRFQLENNQSVAVDQQSYLGLLAPVRCLSQAERSSCSRLPIHGDASARASITLLTTGWACTSGSPTGSDGYGLVNTKTLRSIQTPRTAASDHGYHLTDSRAVAPRYARTKIRGPGSRDPGNEMPQC